MHAPIEDLEDAALGTLFGRLVDDGKRLAKAEVAIQVATVRTRIDRSKTAVVMLVAALLLVIAGVIVLVAALGHAIGLLLGIGPAGGLAIAGVLVLALAGLLAKVAVGRISTAATETVA